MTNAAAIPTRNGGGAHGHMALTLTALAYADIMPNSRKIFN
jgi:hypothetical protein